MTYAARASQANKFGSILQALTGGSSGGFLNPIYSFVRMPVPDGDILFANESANGNWLRGYDAASQLTGINYTLGSNTLGNLTYAYDLAGQRTGVGGSYARTGTPQAAAAATYNVNNQLTQWKGASLTYDANGNLTGDGTNTYTWNARNQLVAISGGASASLQYDPFGRRVSKTIGGTTQYLYDRANPVQEISGTTASANLLTGGLDEYFQRTDSAGARNFLTDALGSTLALADSTGTLQTQYSFEPFGNTSVTGTATTNSFAYTGRELDATGLYFYRARYYDPAVGRFLAEDPIRSPVQPNRYKYVRNSSPNRIDSSGMTDQPPSPSGMWGRYRGCRLVGSLALTLSTYETNKTPTSDWQFVSSFQIGPELGEGFGVPSAAITCLWQRTYSAELWGHVLTIYTWHCWSSDCFGYHQSTDHTFQWSTKDLGKTSGTEPTPTHHLGQGAEDETNDILCVTDPKFRPRP